MSSQFLSLAFIEGLGGGEMMLIFFVVLLLFGGQRMPELARGLGKSIREFKKATAGVEEQIKRAMDEEPEPKTLRKPPVYTTTTIEPSDTLDSHTPPAIASTTPAASASDTSASTSHVHNRTTPPPSGTTPPPDDKPVA